MENSKKKIYKSIKENESIIERNFKVINLDVDNLALEIYLDQKCIYLLQQ